METEKNNIQRWVFVLILLIMVVVFVIKCRTPRVTFDTTPYDKKVDSLNKVNEQAEARRKLAIKRGDSLQMLANKEKGTREKVSVIYTKRDSVLKTLSADTSVQQLKKYLDNE